MRGEGVDDYPVVRFQAHVVNEFALVVHPEHVHLALRGVREDDEGMVDGITWAEIRTVLHSDGSAAQMALTAAAAGI